MGITALAIVLILEGINLAFTAFMSNLLLGILLIIVGAILLLERYAPQTFHTK